MKKMLAYWKAWELAWLLVFGLTALWITLVTGDNLFGFVVFLSGVLCVVLVAKGSILNYPAGVVNTLGYAWIALHNGLYGEAGLNLIFYFPMNFVGFFLWRRHTAGGIVKMRALRPGTALIFAIGCAVLVAALGFGLSLIPSQNTPYIDAATNVLSVAATLLMVRRYREQWICYIALNVLTVTMWAVRMANGSPDGLLMIVMWSAYLVNSVYGWLNWSKGAREAGRQ
ncbi:MAG: nicotinamide riboside transporter PnuC [Clostridiales Family XIII bacterium]|jgi:nicotinamide mononucleotide transporter|nr:nicotinamide riboside transporter PnuC [Clostridiales Family XIII bacterium]